MPADVLLTDLLTPDRIRIPLRAQDKDALLSELVRTSGAAEATLFGANNRIIATSSLDPAAVVPGYPNEEVVFQLRRGQSYVSLEPRPDGAFQIVAAVSEAERRPRFDERLHVLFLAAAELHDEMPARRELRHRPLEHAA